MPNRKNVYYHSGQVKYSIPFVDGKIHGEEKKYYKDGMLAGITRYVGGEKNGSKLTYDCDGWLVLETPYVDDKKNGTELEFNGAVVRTRIPYVNGLRHGITSEVGGRRYYLLGKELSRPEYEREILIEKMAKDYAQVS